MKKFNKETIQKLKRYVYLLSDPETGDIFYVGKGKGNRVFSHLKDYSNSGKAKKIKELKSRNLDPKIEILVHGIDDELTIKKIESAMIDLIGKNNLTNVVGGYESTDFGRMDITQIVAKYNSKEARITEPVLLIKLSDTFRYNMDPMELYDYTRGIWMVNENRVKNVSYAFSIYDGIIQETYKALEWFPAGSTYSSRTDKKSWKVNMDKRREFVGHISENMRKKYRYKSVEHYFKSGARNPLLYLNT